MKRIMTASAKISLVAASLAAAGLTMAQPKPAAPASHMAGAVVPGVANARGKVEVVVGCQIFLGCAQGESAKQRGLALNARRPTPTLPA